MYSREATFVSSVSAFLLTLFGAFSLSIIDPLFLTLQELKNASAGENHYTVFSFMMNLSSFTSTAGRCMQERLNRHKVKPELALMLMYKTDSTVLMTRHPFKVTCRAVCLGLLILLRDTFCCYNRTIKAVVMSGFIIAQPIADTKNKTTCSRTASVGGDA